MGISIILDVFVLSDTFYISDCKLKVGCDILNTKLVVVEKSEENKCNLFVFIKGVPDTDAIPLLSTLRTFLVFSKIKIKLQNQASYAHCYSYKEYFKPKKVKKYCKMSLQNEKYDRFIGYSSYFSFFKLILQYFLTFLSLKCF